MSKILESLVTIVVILPLIGACGGKRQPLTSDTLVGMWNIDKVNGSQDYLICFVTNVVHFDLSICKLPVSNGVCDSLGADDSGGIWNLTKSTNEPYFLTIGSRNKFFAGKYKVSIEDDSLNRLMKMHLTSDRVDFVLRKWHVNYELQKESIRRLSEETSIAADSASIR